MRYYFIDRNNKPSDATLKNHHVSEKPTVDPVILEGKEVILFLHGLGSRAEEADALGEALQERDSKYVVLTMDLPNQGYSARINPFDIAPLSVSGSLKHYEANACIPVPPPGFGCIPVTKEFDGFDSNGRHRVPILDFTEDAVVAFVDALDAKLVSLGGGPRVLKKRIKGVAGGSLGGNLGLRLGRRHLDWGAGSTSSAQWGQNERVVAWSPASVWDSQAHSALLNLTALTTSFNNASHSKEDGNDRYKFIDAKFFKPVSDPLPIIPPGPATWYRWDWPCLDAVWLSDALSVQEVYDPLYRLTIKRLEFEQLLYSHASDPEMIAPGSWQPGQNQPLTPPLPYKPMSFNFVPTVLLAGGGDNFLFAEIYHNTVKRAAEMSVSGRLLLLGSPGPATDNNLDPLKSTSGPSAADPTENTGHSIASERPRLLAYVIDKNFAHPYVAKPD